ncbi:MAG: DUF998 domain-containing protein [Candidatus Thermoplasmatota archaeon]|jgi:hypothetical membrane protein|nr:DUF998 domain-containing protein [Candidatus Thermoplasmatota archaeon]MCL5786309.1 DUF998 domain-containing protein [Candidatus Thermoplasmatota archaeon]
MVGGIIFFLCTTAAEAAIPGYSVRTDAISYLGGAGSPTELFWNFQLLVVGVLWIASTYLLFRGRGHVLLSVSFYLTSIGIVMVSLFPWNVLSSLHGIGALMAFIFGSLTCIGSPRIISGQLKKTSVSLGLISLAAWTLNIFGLANVLGGGGAERMLYYPIILWAIAFGAYLQALHSNAVPSSGA